MADVNNGVKTPWQTASPQSNLLRYERGYCLMIGGDPTVVRRLDPIFATLAPGIGNIARIPGREKLGGTCEQGYLYLYCGPA